MCEALVGPGEELRDGGASGEQDMDAGDSGEAAEMAAPATGKKPQCHRVVFRSLGGDGAAGDPHQAPLLLRPEQRGHVPGLSSGRPPRPTCQASSALKPASSLYPRD